MVMRRLKPVYAFVPLFVSVSFFFIDNECCPKINLFLKIALSLLSINMLPCEVFTLKRRVAKELVTKAFHMTDFIGGRSDSSMLI